MVQPLTRNGDMKTETRKEEGKMFGDLPVISNMVASLYDATATDDFEVFICIESSPQEEL